MAAAGGHGVGEDALPSREDQVRGYAQGPPLVAFGDEGEEDFTHLNLLPGNRPEPLRLQRLTCCPLGRIQSAAGEILSWSGLNTYRSSIRKFRNSLDLRWSS